MSAAVVVRAPATVANLGPGFDAMGLALAWYDEVSVERHDALEITASGLGAEGVRRDETNSVAAAIGALTGEPARVRIHKMTAVAFGRGFGSSAISIVAGLVAGRALFATGHSDQDLLRIAADLEGHADNVAPCLLGGVVVTAGAGVVRLDPPQGLRALVCVAPRPQATTDARAALPGTVSWGDAVESVGRAALLAAALATGRTDALLEATEDRLHQPARFALMPDAGALVRALRAEGIAAFLSGAGPSVAAFVEDARAAEAEAAAKGLVPDGWEIRIESVASAGAAVVDER